MSDQSIISRREALLAAVSISTVVATSQFASADGPPEKTHTPDSERDQKPKPSEIPSRFKLSITLTDGQVVTFNATEAVIDFGASGQLLVRPTGVMPASGPKPRPENDPFESPFEKNSKGNKHSPASGDPAGRATLLETSPEPFGRP